MTDSFEKTVTVDGPGVNEGELGSSTFSPDHGMPVGPLAHGQRWTVTRKREVVLRLLRGEAVELVSRELGVEVSEQSMSRILRQMGFLHQNWFSNRVFKSYDDIVDHCCYAWNQLTDQPWTIMSIGLRDWAGQTQ